MKFPAPNVPGEGRLHAKLVTTLGDIVVRLEEERAPNMVNHFVGHSLGTLEWKDPKSGQTMKGVPLYSGVRFHRVIPDFMVQCGDPNSRYPELASNWGRGNPGYRFPDEFHPDLRHSGPGVLSMANSGPNTNGTQFFITERATPHLDNKHSVFGVVVGGMEIVSKIARVPRSPGDRPNQDVILERIEIFRQ